MKYINLLKRNLIDFVKTKKLYKFYSKNSQFRSLDIKSQVIAMFDGRLNHGGISDRLWGMVSLYKYCKENQCDFKIFFNNPFKLDEFLQPNQVNWTITEKEIIYDLSVAQPKYISMLPLTPHDMGKALEIKLKSCKPQKHIYSNTRSVTKREFNTLYHELFKMSPFLNRELDMLKQKVNQDYISCAFRFQQLLGDFKDQRGKVYKNQNQRDELIEKCKNVIVKLGNLKHSPILVTSDSNYFLNCISGMENVITIKGEIIHCDYDTNNSSSQTYLKLFLDIYMIANAREIYVCNMKPLYRSGLPGTAACIYNRPYYEIMDFENLNIIHGFN